MPLDGVTSFSHIKIIRNTRKCLIIVKVVGGICSCNGRQQEKSDGYICCFVVSCVNRNKFLLTSNLLSNISLSHLSTPECHISCHTLIFDQAC